MKLAHLADLHLGFRQYARQTANGINQREADVAGVFRRAVDDVIEAAPDIVVVAGDLFHSVRPTNPAILDSFRQFQKLADALPDTPIVIVAGNHDTPRSVETGSILGLFEAIANVNVVSGEARRLRFEALDLSVLCVPDQALREAARPSFDLDPQSALNVLVTHGEVQGLFPGDRSFAEYGGAVFEPEELDGDSWNYVALGHYHVTHRVARNAWYSGSLEYVSHNPWGELREGAKAGFADAKGWLLANIEDKSTDVEFKPVAPVRRHLDLETIDADELSAEDVNVLLAERVESVSGGIDQQVVRQVVVGIGRHVSRELDHALIREFKSRALNYHLDLRRPGAKRQMGAGSPGKKQTLDEVVVEYLKERSIPSGISREALVELGNHYLVEVERERAEG